MSSVNVNITITGGSRACCICGNIKSRFNDHPTCGQCYNIVMNERASKRARVFPGPGPMPFVAPDDVHELLLRLFFPKVMLALLPMPRQLVLWQMLALLPMPRQLMFRLMPKVMMSLQLMTRPPHTSSTACAEHASEAMMCLRRPKCERPFVAPPCHCSKNSWV